MNVVASHNEWLDKLWDACVQERMCACNSDLKWEQDVGGWIRCGGCQTVILSKAEIKGDK